MYSQQWMYHQTLAPKGRLIRSEAEEALLVEDGWFDTPAKFGTRYIPTKAEVLAAGYSDDAADRVIAREIALNTAPPTEEQGMALADPLTTEDDEPLPVGTVIPTLPGRRGRR